MAQNLRAPIVFAGTGIWSQHPYGSWQRSVSNSTSSALFWSLPASDKHGTSTPAHKSKPSKAWWVTPLISAPGRQRQAGLHKEPLLQTKINKHLENSLLNLFVHKFKVVFLLLCWNWTVMTEPLCQQNLSYLLLALYMFSDCDLNDSQIYQKWRKNNCLLISVQLLKVYYEFLLCN